MNTRILFRFNSKNEFIEKIIQGYDPQATKRNRGKISFSDMPNATEISPPPFNNDFEKAIFKNGYWFIEDIEIEGNFYLK